ncbi:MAG: twin-arginine translocase TatA/TatE family subunit [Nitrososphaerota archaeon]|nr:twin-arginine translocase TatA/TatE family subunit [Nitrososphaerota archaeon]
MAIVLFGTSRIPQLARAIGQSKREYENGARGVVPTQQVNDTLLLKSHDKNSP